MGINVNQMVRRMAKYWDKKIADAKTKKHIVHSGKCKTFSIFLLKMRSEPNIHDNLIRQRICKRIDTCIYV